MDDLSCRCVYFEPHMSLQGLEVPHHLGFPPLTTTWTQSGTAEAVSAFAAGGSCPPSGADDAGDAGVWIPRYLGTLHRIHSSAQHGRVASQQGYQQRGFAHEEASKVRLPARLVPRLTYPVPTYAQQRLFACAAPAMM